MGGYLVDAQMLDIEVDKLFIGWRKVVYQRVQLVDELVVGNVGHIVVSLVQRPEEARDEPLVAVAADGCIASHFHHPGPHVDSLYGSIVFEPEPQAVDDVVVKAVAALDVAWVERTAEGIDINTIFIDYGGEQLLGFLCLLP